MVFWLTAKDTGSARVTPVLFRRCALGEQGGVGTEDWGARSKELSEGSRWRRGRGPLQIEWSEGEVLKLAGVGKEAEKEFGSPGRRGWTTFAFGSSFNAASESLIKFLAASWREVRLASSVSMSWH